MIKELIQLATATSLAFSSVSLPGKYAKEVQILGDDNFCKDKVLSGSIFPETFFQATESRYSQMFAKPLSNLQGVPGWGIVDPEAPAGFKDAFYRAEDSAGLLFAGKVVFVDALGRAHLLNQAVGSRNVYCGGALIETPTHQPRGGR